MVIGLKRAGWSLRQIAADTHLGASTVHRLWRRWLEQGNVAIYRNVGATRVTSARVDRRILRQAVAAPQATCTAILQHVQDTLDHSISTRTISRRLVANGLHSCRPLRRLPLNPPNRRQRLEWCRARSTWMTEWHRVVFSDESRFCLSSDSRRVRVWRRRGERSNPAAIVERPTVRQRGIMVWGAIAYDSRSPLLRIQGTMTAQRYVDDVLRPVTLPYLQGVPNALYQQDNARPHTARISQQALQDVQMLPWPPYSPDLSPIEHVWDIIGRRLHTLPQARSEDELWQMVEREWRAIPQDAIRTLIDSLPRRVAACIAVRDMRIKVRPGRPKSKPWYSRECYLAKKSAKASLTTFKETNTDVDRNIYVSNRKRYTTLINFNKKKYLQEKQELLKNARDSANFWKTIATLKDKSYIQGNITILEWQCFYNKLLSAETTIGSDLSTLSRIDPELYCEISITEITREISSLANEKACGADEIPNEALKTLPFEHLVTLKNIFNRIINSGSYPLIWSKSIIHPIFKSGDRDNPSNYRGIALISNLSKLFTSILKSRLRNWIEGRSIIPENQAGFRKGYSCQDHIFTLLSLIQLTLRRKRRKLYAFFVDLKKAFDTVPHSLLWSKLGELGLDFRFVNLIRNYFEQMTTTVRWNGLFTEPIKIRSGVLQGEPLSPYLFILFVTDLINIFNDSTLPGIYLPNFGTVHLLMYADDIILIGESKINLQIKINMLKKYFETNHLTLNESKSKIMVFRNGGRPAKSDKWFWGDQLLTVTSKYLYLGYPLTTTISFSQVASYFKGKALAATGEVWKIMEKSRFVAGIIDSSTQKKLLQEEKLTFDGAVDIALSAESADNELHNIKGSENAHQSPQYLHAINNTCKHCDSLINDYGSIFEYKSGHIKGIKCHLDVKADFIPKFYKFRQVPFALKQLVENEIDKLVDLNILSPIDRSDCASPLVCVAKPDGQIRLCADFKKSLNPYLEDVKYPIPNIDSVLSNFQGNKLFTKLDLSKAYHQIEMDDISKKYLVVSTHKGLYKYNRLAFGIKTASEIFQKTMESFFSGINDVYIYFDDILIASEGLESHLDILKRTLKILKENNFTINKNKCLFVKNEIEYLGHKINEFGIYPLKDKLACIKNCPVPKNITELKSFLGFLSFYSKFLPNLSDLAYPLYNLLKKNVKWSWNVETDGSFNSYKNALDETLCLSHYSLNLPLILSCDASQVGIGATLSHLKDGEERPVCFISRTLNVHERKYSQVEREGLAIVFAVNKLKNYLFGRKFTIYTDHKPLITIFGDKTNLPPLIANRLHRWALTLSNFNFEIKYKKGKDNIIPDFLSRFPEFQKNSLEYNDGSSEILLLNTSIIDHVLVAHETHLDRTLFKLYEIIETGELPSSPNDDLIPYLKRIDDFTILQKCIFLENRMVIPKILHEKVLQLLHESHAGTNKMKMMARSSIWWPGMDSSIEIITKNCRTCLSNESLPHQRTESWPKYAGPWRRVHMDYFNFKNRLFLLAVDSFSSWVEVSEVPSTSAYFCINFMRNCIARYGFPQVVVSDNGPPFFSSHFGGFLSKNGISHVTSPPYHPKSNGQAEVSVRE
ncbi:K02A2.6-like, partial [Cordylochernes scorpioides]